MIRKRHISAIAVTLAAVLFLLLLSGCGKSSAAPQVTEPVITSPTLPSIPGTWQTASMGYAADGMMQPEYYVQFSDSDILYGHLKNDQFVLDHADKIRSLEETPAGGYRVQAQASNGVRYTFQTCESDDTILEYDNALAENFFSILKTECIYRQRITTFEAARRLIDDYIFFYNHQRIQDKTKLTPLEKRRQSVA